MSSFYENRDSLTRREKGIILMRSIMDIGMGVLWIGMGIFFIFIKYFSPLIAKNYDDLLMKIFGFVCSLYGCFRIYRGIKKKYLR